MNDHHKKIASTERFKAMADAMGVRSLARYYCVGEEAIRDMLQMVGKGKTPVYDAANDAPSPEEEAASLASLDLAPFVAARADVVFFGGVLDD